MQLERLTIKAQEALQGAQTIAQRFSHQEIDGEHLMVSLLDQTEGLIGPLLQKLGANPRAVGKDIEAELERRAKVTGATTADTFLGTNLKKALDAAQSEAGKLKDDYVSTEHLLLGLVEQGGLRSRRFFKSTHSSATTFFARLWNCAGTSASRIKVPK